MARFVRRARQAGHCGWRANRKVEEVLAHRAPAPLAEHGRPVGGLAAATSEVCPNRRKGVMQPQLVECYFDVLARGVVERPVTSRRGTGSESRCGGGESVDSADGGEVIT